jgi:hypothetical protein
VLRDFLFQVVFHESSSPKPLKISLGSFRFLSKEIADIRRYSQVKVHPRVSTTPAADYATSTAAGVVDTGDK